MFPKQICQTYGHQTSTTLGCERHGIGCERQGILITGNKLFDVTFGSFAEFCRANFWQHSLAIVSQALPKTQLGWFEQESWFLVKSNNDPSTSNLFFLARAIVFLRSTTTTTRRILRRHVGQILVLARSRSSSRRQQQQQQQRASLGHGVSPRLTLETFCARF